MNKSLKALLRGYLFFSVNSKQYLTYLAARQAYDAGSPKISVLYGFHLFKGWLGIAYRGATTCYYTLTETDTLTEFGD